MAEETPVSPISEAMPPKSNPLAKPATHTSTLQLKPVVRKPAIGGAAPAAAPAAAPGAPALKPGLKLPPKPGIAAAGLKLPPKPGVPTAGLKLPPKPGVPAGIKLPPKPGAAPAIAKPAAPAIAKPAAAAPAAHAAAAPAPAAAAPAVAKPALPGAPRPALKPMIRKPGSAPAAAPAAPAAAAAAPAAAAPAAEKPAGDSLETLKAITSSLKSITSPVPAQAILRKTGIIADQELSEAQKQAAKSKTSRISLSEAMGVAPVKKENAPMKTIRIKRPTDIPGGPPKAAPGAAAPAAAPAAGGGEATSLTQRKTLKISRPGAGGAVRPSGKFGVKKPGGPTAPAAAPAASADGGVADIADIPDMPTAATVPFAPIGGGAANTVPDVSAGVAVTSIIVQLAACAAIGALAWFLYQDWDLQAQMLKLF